MNEPIYFTEQHRQFRDNLRRFIDQEIVPRADAWEEAGMVPREVMRQMGELGYLGIRYPEQYGGSGLDTVYSAILAEELGRSTFGGFAVTVTVHTDMASPHLANFGSPEQLERYLPPLIRGEKVCRGRHRARCRLRRGRHPHPSRARWRPLGPRRQQDVHHQRRAR